MNKIYKVVWSKVKNCYVVVFEIAKNVISGSVKSAKIGSIPMVRGATLGAMMAFVITGQVWAANVDENRETEYNNYVLPSGYFVSTSEVASNSSLNNGKRVILNSSYKLYSNPNAFSDFKPDKLETSGDIIYEGSDALFNIYSGFAYNKNTVGEADNNFLIINHNLTINSSSELYGAILAYKGESDEELTISGNTV